MLYEDFEMALGNKKGRFLNLPFLLFENKI